MRRIVVALGFFALSCGGEKGETPAPPATTVVAPPTGPVHEVRMELVGGKPHFTPAEITIKTGDVVRFTNVSGGPHNVAFDKANIPAGAAEVLNASMKGRVMPLTGPFLKDANATYDVSFAGAPAGTYSYNCTPHKLMGMVARVTVSP